MLKRILFMLTVTFVSVAALSQVTTSSITGTVKDEKDQPLVGATISATHTPTGTVYTTISQKNGAFNIYNMRVGGPYTVNISYVGHENERLNDVTLILGESFQLNTQLKTAAGNLEAVTVVGGRRNPVFNNKRTGAATNISRAQLENLPSLNRNILDFTRITPQANGNSFAGASNRFNNITIDGAVNNDVFGLSANGAPGGQANTQPVSLDAIQEIQVVLAPYDVALGNFTGGGINAVTRSGTNNLEGSIYYFTRNQKTVGKYNKGVKQGYPDFKDYQAGFRIGAPLIKNKLFLFVSGELGRRSAPLSYNAGETGSVISAQDAQALATFVQTTYKYDVGGYGPINTLTENNKILGRLDWNINTKHQLTLRHNFIDAFDDNISRSPSGFPAFRFENNAYKFNNKQNVTVLELRSRFSNRSSNNLIIGYSRIRDDRKTAGALFPQVTINVSSSSSVEFGSQRSSVANELDQDIFEFTDNYKLFRGKHSFTFGTHNEFFKFRNLFINNFNGRWDFNSLQDFYDNKPSRARATYSLLPGDPKPSAEFSAMQLAFYAQDEIQANPKFRLTIGLRADIPIISDKPLANDQFAASFPGEQTDRTPSGKLLWSPRVGFNYDVAGDKTLQIRGGLGIFTGRVPFVWLSNQFSNSGKLFGTVDVSGSAINNGNGFEPDPTKQSQLGGSAQRVEINAVTKDFKIPQVFRANVAADARLSGGIVSTTEFIFSKTINNVLYQDINLVAPSGTLNSAYSSGADKRPVYPSNRRKNDSFSNAILLSNISRGFTFNATQQFTKSFSSGLDLMAAYTYGIAMDINSGASSTALSQWEFVQISRDPNNPDLAISNYNLKHRIIGSVSYNLKWNDNFRTNFGLFYNGRSGTPFTYLYNNDLNGDGNRNNDLLFVPRTQADINLQATSSLTVAQQWAALDAFISNDPYLSKIRGQYTERNAAETPWEHNLDFRLLQDIAIKTGSKKHTLQLTFDVFNFTNLLNKDWGKNYFINNQAFTLINRQSSSAFTHTPVTSAYSLSDLGSRWQGQFGIRYIFN